MPPAFLGKNKDFMFSSRIDTIRQAFFPFPGDFPAKLAFTAPWKLDFDIKLLLLYLPPSSPTVYSNSADTLSSFLIYTEFGTYLFWSFSA